MTTLDLSNSENFVTIVEGIDAIGDGYSLIYRNDELFARLEYSGESAGYILALAHFDIQYQLLDLEHDDWEVAEMWGLDAPVSSLKELLASAKENYLTVTTQKPFG